MASNLKDDPYTITRNADAGNPEYDSHGQIATGLHQQIQTKPVSSAAIAATVGIGAGLLLSVLLTSERSRKEQFARRMANYLAGSGNIRSSIGNLLPNSITDRL